MSTRRAVWIFIGALTLVRLTLIATTNLSGDEAHYWMWSDRLAPAYFSKGPGVAFAMRAGTALFGANEFGVRFWSPILAAGTSLLMFQFARRLFDEVAGLWAVIGLNVTPIFNVGAFVMTIDPLSVFFWVAAMFSFWRAIQQTPRTTFWWPLSGLLVGLGFLCKYTNALELISILLVLGFAPRLRGEFKRAGIYLLIVSFIICTIPPLLWNRDHAWITITHLEARGGVDHGFGIHPSELLTFIGQHFGVYSPLLFIAICWAVIASWPRVQQQLKVLFLTAFGVPIFVFYFLLSINRAAAPNWDALAFPSFGLLALYFWRERLDRSTTLRTLAGAAFALGLLISMIAVDSDLPRSFGFTMSRRDPTDRVRGWSAGTAAVEQMRRTTEARIGERVFLIADERDHASEISFYLADRRVEGSGHPPVYLVESQDLQNQFSFWPRYDEFVAGDAKPKIPNDPDYSEEGGSNIFTGRSALYIRTGGKQRLPRNIHAAFDSTEPVGTIEMNRYGKVIRTWDVYLCRGYKTLPL